METTTDRYVHRFFLNMLHSKLYCSTYNHESNPLLQKISKKKQQKEDEEISLEDVVPEKVSKILKEDQKEREAPPFCPTVGNKNGNGKEEQENVWADEVMEEEEDYDGEQLPQNEEEENTDFLL